MNVDERLAHYFQPETKRARREWRHSNSPKRNKFLAQTLLGKVMLTLFWDSKGLCLEHCMTKGTTITSSPYCDLLVKHLKPAFPSNCRGLLTTSVLLLHDNFRPHTAHATAAKIQGLQFWVSPSITILTRPYAFRVPSVWDIKIGPVRKKVQVCWRSSRDGAWPAVQATKDFLYSRGFQDLVKLMRGRKV